MTRHPKQLGVTLVELLIAVVIVSILAAIAVPSYTQYIRSGERQKAAACLIDLGRRFETFYQQRNSYPDSLATLSLTSATSCLESKYDLAIETDGPDCDATASFRLTATAKQTHPEQTQDGILTLDYCFNADPSLRYSRTRSAGDGLW